jgi:hypothetical protein
LALQWLKVWAVASTSSRQWADSGLLGDTSDSKFDIILQKKKTLTMRTAINHCKLILA